MCHRSLSATHLLTTKCQIHGGNSKGSFPTKRSADSRHIENRKKQKDGVASPTVEANGATSEETLPEPVTQNQISSGFYVIKHFSISLIHWRNKPECFVFGKTLHHNRQDLPEQGVV